MPSVSYKAFTDFNWGANGRFIYCSAPWYALELGATSLSNFPIDCKMLMVMYDDDDANDHRMGMDVFNNIAIHDSIKDCLIAYSNTVSGYDYEADHTMPAQYVTGAEFDALDCYITFRLMDALADYTFTGNLLGRDVALGNGSTAQIDMGGQLIDLYSTNNPSPIYPESIYDNPCTHATNERTAFCQDIIGFEEMGASEISIYPNPSKGNFTIELGDLNNASIKIYNVGGQLIYQSDNISSNTHQIQLNPTSGIYLISIVSDELNQQLKLVVD